jgi:hypothetical protein
MPIEVAAESGERFAKKRTKDNAWKDARVSVVLGAGEEKAVVIPCVFAPERVVVDPDVTVLMLERKKAEVKVKAEGGALASR